MSELRWLRFGGAKVVINGMQTLHIINSTTIRIVVDTGKEHLDEW